MRNWKDEELLHAVLANVAQGYYYSITGDLYLQRAWKQLKFNLEPTQAKGLPVPAVKKTKAVKQTNQQTEKATAQKMTAKKIGKTEKESAATRKKKETERNVPVNAVSVSVSSIPESEVSTPKQTIGEKTSISVQIYPINEPKELPISIAETVKKVTGKSYGIYRDLFFKEVRSAIRTILQHAAVQKLSFFGSEQNNAENIIYRFLETNYDNPYQQWQGSREQADVFAQGFRIDSLEPIIRLWAKENL